MQPPPAPLPQVAPSPSSPTGGVRLTVGLVLVAPALIALLVCYLVPTGLTLWRSFQDYSLIGSAELVGFDNYSRLAGDFAGWLPYTLALAVLPLLAVLLVGPLLAMAAHYAGRPVRLVVRLALTVLMVCFAPVALAVAWLVHRFDVESARASVWAAIGLSGFGLACAVGATVFLAVLRGRTPGGSAWPAGLVVGGLAAATVVAVALQAFTFPFLITRGGPANQTVTPVLDVYVLGFQRLEFGAGAAEATLLLLPLMALGIGAAVLAILTGLRIEVARAPERRGHGLAVAGAIVGLVVVLAIALYGLWPWLAGLGRLDPSSVRDASVPAMLFRTWFPPLLSTVLGVGLAAVAGFGIGALRPLGRWSELLLLPFAPWLFVGVGPLSLSRYEIVRQLDLVDTFPGLIPQAWPVVPALFVFTLLFRGLARSADQPAGSGYGGMVLRALPMLALVGGATWLVQSQSLLWPLLSATDPDLYPAPVWLAVVLGAANTASADALPLGLILPIPMIVLFVIGLGVLHIFYLDRLAIRVGRERGASVRHTGAG